MCAQWDAGFAAGGAGGAADNDESFTLRVTLGSGAAAAEKASRLAHKIMDAADRFVHNGKLTQTELQAFLPNHLFTGWLGANLSNFDLDHDGSLSGSELVKALLQFDPHDEEEEVRVIQSHPDETVLEVTEKIQPGGELICAITLLCCECMCSALCFQLKFQFQVSDLNSAAAMHTIICDDCVPWV